MPRIKKKKVSAFPPAVDAISGHEKLVTAAIAATLERLGKYFVPEAELTFIMRLPGHPNTEMVITCDDLNEIQAVIERMKERGARG